MEMRAGISLEISRKQFRIPVLENPTEIVVLRHGHSIQHCKRCHMLSLSGSNFLAKIFIGYSGE